MINELHKEYLKDDVLDLGKIHRDIARNALRNMQLLQILIGTGNASYEVAAAFESNRDFCKIMRSASQEALKNAQARG